MFQCVFIKNKNSVRLLRFPSYFSVDMLGSVLNAWILFSLLPHWSEVPYVGPSTDNRSRLGTMSLPLTLEIERPISWAVLSLPRVGLAYRLGQVFLAVLVSFSLTCYCLDTPVRAAGIPDLLFF